MAAEDGDTEDGRAVFTFTAASEDNSCAVCTMPLNMLDMGYHDVTASLTVTEVDADSAPPGVGGVTVTPTSLTVSEGESATYTVKLDAQPTTSVTVTLTKTGDRDLTASPETLSFTPSNWNRPQAVTVSTVPDEDAVGGTVTIAHTASGGNYGSVSIASVTVTVTDGDTAGVTVTPTSLTVSEGESATYTVKLDTLPTAAVAVSVSPSDDGDLTASPGTLSFTPSNWSTRRRFGSPAPRTKIGATRTFA